MPIVGPSSYVPCTQEFLDHWTDVDAALSSGEPLVLEDGTAVGDFGDVRVVLIARRDELETADLEAALTRAALAMAKEVLLAKLNFFNQKVRGAMGASVYARVLPLVPGIGDGQEVFSKPMVQAAKLWAKINAAPPAGVTAPVVLVDDTSQAAFAALVSGLEGLYGAVVGTDQDFTLALQARNDVQEVLYRMMKEYRLVVPTRFLPGSALLESMPALTPDSSRTPDAVSLSGAWNAGDTSAHLTGTVSSDPDLKDYELRWCAGASYSTDTEHTVGTVPGGAPPVWVTLKGLMTAGAVASFRAYVRLTSGGEAGSNTVVITRT